MKITSFIIGMGAGATIAMLFAPRSGKETREMISDRAEQGRKFAKKQAREVREMATQQVGQIRDIAMDQAQQVRDMAADVAQRGKEVIGQQKNAVTAAVKAAKETYQREAPVKPS
jgi:gas vesicle protein